MVIDAQLGKGFGREHAEMSEQEIRVKRVKVSAYQEPNTGPKWFPIQMYRVL